VVVDPFLKQDRLIFGQELYLLFQLGPGMDGKHSGSPAPAISLEYTGFKGQSGPVTSLQELERMVINEGPGMGQVMGTEKANLTGFAPVEVSGAQSGKMVWGQLSHLTIANWRKILGHEDPGRLAQQVL
jgi:hypothetical protein